MQDPLDFSESIASAERSIGGQKIYGNVKSVDGCIAFFYGKEEQDPQASEAAGRPIFRTDDWLRVLIPATRDRYWDAPVSSRPDLLLKYADQWADYQAKKAMRIDGTPIVEWQGIARTRGMELRALGFWSVEQLADANDSVLHKIGPDANKLRAQAKAYCEGQRELDAEKRMRAELESGLAEQRAANAELLAKLDELTKRFDSEGADDAADHPTDRPGGSTKHRR